VQLGLTCIRCISGLNACGTYLDARLAVTLLPATQASLATAAAAAAAEEALAAERLQHQQASVAAAATAQAELQRVREEFSAAMRTMQEAGDAALAASLHGHDAVADTASAAAAAQLSRLQARVTEQTAQTAGAMRAAAQSEQWIQDNTRPCPNCGRRIEKNGGCLHMTCPARPVGCGREYFWCCSRPFPDARHRLFNCCPI
jgi:NADH pyrophosphatase NudC (nudix superfamily)